MDWLKLKTWQCGRQRMLRGASMTWQGARSGVVPLKTQWGKEANPSIVTGHSKNMCSPMRCPSCWIDSETKWCPHRTSMLFSVPASRFCVLYRCLLSCSLWDQIGVSSLLINVHGGKENLRSLSLAWGPKVRTWVLPWPGATFLSLQQLCHLPHLCAHGFHPWISPHVTCSIRPCLQRKPEGLWCLGLGFKLLSFASIPGLGPKYLWTPSPNHPRGSSNSVCAKPSRKPK